LTATARAYSGLFLPRCTPGRRVKKTEKREVEPVDRETQAGRMKDLFILLEDRELIYVFEQKDEEKYEEVERIFLGDIPFMEGTERKRVLELKEQAIEGHVITLDLLYDLDHLALVLCDPGEVVFVEHYPYYVPIWFNDSFELIDLLVENGYLKFEEGEKVRKLLKEYKE